jgi:hypothetical protein
VLSSLVSSAILGHQFESAKKNVQDDDDDDDDDIILMNIVSRKVVEVINSMEFMT